MRYFCTLFSALTVALIAAPVAAQAQKDQSPGAESLTRIETDSEPHEIRFYVDGKLAAVLKDDGFHVREHMKYGGTLTDYGTEGFSTFGEQDVKEADDDAE